MFLRLMLLSAVCLSCTTDPGDAPFRVFVVDLETPDYVGSDAAFALTEREILGADDFDDLSGPNLRLLRGGSLFLRESAGSVIADGAFTGGLSPELRYSVEDGLIVAKDYSSLSMVSAYYHFERAIASVAALTEGSVEDFVGGEPLEILFEPQLESEGVSLTLKLNAFFFHGDRRQFGLLQRSAIETISLGTNPLVIAHETGHAVFEWLFYGGKAPECDLDGANSLEPNFEGRLTVEFSMSGFNEGLADFYAFSLYGSTDVFSGLGLLDNDERDLRSEATFDDIGECTGSFYCLGSLLARSLYQTYLQLGYREEEPSERAEFARQVSASLTGARARMRAEPLPEAFGEVRSCNPPQSFNVMLDPPVAARFLTAFAEGLPEASRIVFCERAVLNFGVDGFPLGARGVCQP